MRRFTRKVERIGQRAISIVLCSLLPLLITAEICRAQSRTLPVPRSKLDVLLLFDSSGSMLKTDPKGLRYEGAQLLTSFLADGDRLGVVQFAGDAKVVQDLENFAPGKADQIMGRIRGISTEGIFTDITEGIKVGAAMFEKSARPDAQRVVVVLSDGKVEPDPAIGLPFARTLQLVHDILPELKAKEIRVFTLALSDQADRALLGEIAVATDGLTWHTQTAEEMHKSFAELFLAVKRPQVVVQKGKGFSIDADVDEATFYINHESGGAVSLVSPKGEVMSLQQHPHYVTWFSGQNFDVVTVKEPDLGEWQVAGTNLQDGFAAVLTDLKLLTDWPLVVRAGDEPLLQARLYEETKPVALPEMSSVVNFAFQIVATDTISKPLVQEALNDRGERGDVIALDGIFSSRVGSLAPGAYKLTVVAKGPTFQRSQQLPFTVRPRLVTLEARSPDSEFHEHDEAHKDGDNDDKPGDATPHSTSEQSGLFSGDESTEFLVTVSKEALALKSLRVSLEALSRDREVIALALKRRSANSREYVATASSLRESGLYKVKASIKGSNQRREEITGESPLLSFQLDRRVIPEASPSAQAHDEHQAAHTKLPLGKDAIPFVPLVAVSVFNLLLFLLVGKLSKKKKKATSATSQRYLPPAQLLESLEKLEVRASLSAVSADDPIFRWIETQGKEDDVEDAEEKNAPAQDVTTEELA